MYKEGVFRKERAPSDFGMPNKDLAGGGRTFGAGLLQFPEGKKICYVAQIMHVS